MPSSDPEEDLAHLHLRLPGLMHSTIAMAIKDHKSSLPVDIMPPSANSMAVDQAIDPNSQKFSHETKSCHKIAARAAKRRILASSGNFSYVCRICSKEFPSGRALAGHMRIHGGLEHATAELNTHLHQQRQLCEGGRHSQVPSLPAGADSLQACLSTEPNHESQMLCENQDNLARSAEAVAIEDDQEPLMVEEEEEEEEEDEENEDEGEDSDGEDCHKSTEASQYTDGDADAADDDDELFRGDQFRMISNRRNHAATTKVAVKAPREARHAEDEVRQQQAFRIEDDNDEEADVNSKENIRIDGFKRSSGQLYQLRHNPKRSRLLTDQEFHNQVFVDIQLLGRSSKSYAAVVNSVQEGTAVACACVCPVCSKEFPSQKSLFGHMRCHPERDWRGIQPPVAMKSTQATLYVSPEPATAGSSGLHRHGNLSECANPSASDLKKMNTELNPTSQASDLNKRSSEFTPTALASDLNKMFTESNKIPSTKYICESKTDDGMHFKSKFTEKPTKDSVLDSHLIQRKENSASLSSFAWSTFGKRSRRRRRGWYMPREISSTPETAITSESTQEAVDEDEEEAKAIGGFRSLSEINGGKGDDENIEPRRKVLHTEAGRGKILHNEDDDIASCLLLLSAGEDKSKNQNQPKDPIMNKDSESPSHGNNILHKNEPADGHKGTLGSPIVMYECSICKKSFSSPQALGGHRASHKKKNESCGQGSVLTSVVNASGENDLIEQNASKLGAMSMPSLINPDMETDQSVLKSTTKGHKCSICHRVFPTGQALGGHKRRHWTGEKTPEYASSAASNNQDHLSSPITGSGVQKMMIDLNLPAPVDGEEDEVVDFTSPLAEENVFDAKNITLY